MSSDIVDINTTTEVLEVEVSNWQFGTLVESYVLLVEKTSNTHFLHDRVVILFAHRYDKRGPLALVCFYS